MAAYTKFFDFIEQLFSGVHNFTAAGHVMRLMLTNTAPAQTNTVKTDITEIAAGNGYTAGGEDSQNTLAEASGTVTVTCTNITWTCVTAAMATFRYLVMYNDNATSPLDALVGFWDRGASLQLQVGETYTAKFNNGASSGTLLTAS